MKDLKPEELSNIKQLKKECKFTEALKVINELEDNESFTLQDQFEIHHFKSVLLFEQGYMDEALEYAELAYKESKRLNNNLLILDTILTKSNIFRYSGRHSDAIDSVNEAEQLLKTIDYISPIQLKEKNAFIMYIKSYIYCNIGDLNKALKYAQKGLQLGKELNNKRLIMLNAGTLGVIFAWIGDFDASQKYNKLRLKLAKDINDKQSIIGALNNIGTIFRDKGNFSQAMKYIKKSLALCEEINSFKTPAILDTLCRLAIEMDSFETAQDCLEYIKKFSRQRDKKILFGYDLYDLTKALVLKNSPNEVDKIRARELLKKVLEKDEVSFEEKIVALLNLCNLLLVELYQTNNIKILDEINLYIQQTLDIAKEQKSYWLLAETYLFQAKLKLLTFEFKKAKNLLSQALDIAEKYGETLLAEKISIEQDDLSNEKSKWEALRNSEAIMADRIELAHLNDQIVRMLRKRVYLNKIIE